MNFIQGDGTAPSGKKASGPGCTGGRRGVPPAGPPPRGTRDDHCEHGADGERRRLRSDAFLFDDGHWTEAQPGGDGPAVGRRCGHVQRDGVFGSASSETESWNTEVAGASEGTVRRLR